MWPWTSSQIEANTAAVNQNTAALKLNTASTDRHTKTLEEHGLIVARNSGSLRQNSVQLARLIVHLERLIDLLKRPPNPGPLHLRILSEGTNDMLNFEIDLPVDSGTGDVASGELTLSIGVGNTPSVIATAKGQLAVTGLSGDQDTQVDASFVFIDDAGNKSTTPATLSVVLRDTFPPESPAALGLRVVGESNP